MWKTNLPEILAAFGDSILQACRQLLDERFQVGVLQRLPQLRVGVFAERVEI